MKRRILYIFDHIEEIIILFFFSAMCISMFLQLFSRFVLNDPMFFTEEISRYSYIWVTFIGVSYAVKKNTHIRIELFTQNLPEKFKKLLKICVDLGSMVIFIYLTYWGIRYADFNKVILSPALEVSLIVIAVSLPVGFGLAIIRSIKLLLEEIKEYKNLISNPTQSLTYKR